uniref:Hydin adenylate kinase-like domain-containing protein n=1 Tax=Periophthalmus magnuspinnatus TaxID=409849 RepID=A0A3B4AWU3_9GOBI
MYWRTSGFLNKRQRVNKSGSQTSLPPIFPPKTKILLPHQRSLGSPGVERPVFSLNPSRVELFPGQSVDMILTGSCYAPKTVHERLVCHSIVGNTGSCDSIMTVDVTCCFVAPMLSIYPKHLHFNIEKVPGKSISPQYRRLFLKNISTLTLFMDLQTVEPFSLSHAQAFQSSATTMVFISQILIQFHVDFLEINYQGHPQQDIVKLHGEIHFPNLLLSSTSVDFGCVLNSTETQREITITNCSPLPVMYHWTFLDQKPSGLRYDPAFNRLKPVYVKLLYVPLLRITLWVISVPPSYGQKVSKWFFFVFFYIYLFVTAISFYGHDYVSREVVAQCHVEDGPVYEVTLKGEASQVSFSLDYTSVDFGQKSSDCHRGIVINGLQSAFTATIAHTLQIVLKALNNRKHIYVVNIFDSYSALQSREKAQKDQQRQQEDLKRLKEEELKKNNKKAPKKEIQKEPPKKKEIKMVCLSIWYSYF